VVADRDTCMDNHSAPMVTDKAIKSKLELSEAIGNFFNNKIIAETDNIWISV